MEDYKEAVDEGPAYYDAITGLPNKTLFYDRLTQALALSVRNEEALSVLFVSIDNLKIINDIFGQECGDQLLNSLSRRIKGCLRRSDTVARPGRDEFMILLPEITRAEDASFVARKILDSLNSPFMIGKQELFVNAVIGISVRPVDGCDGTALIKNSYTAMLHAKESGKNSYKFFSPSMNDSAYQKMVIENGLRLALSRGEFVLHYQPQVDLCTGMISGMEALVRWKRPDADMVYPNDFIHLMEQNGLIVPLGRWVLHNACAQSRRWQQEGLKPVRIAVNISARQFHEQNIIEAVCRALDETGLEPHLLELELTESIFMKDIDAVVKALHAFRRMGVQISIDDFGTGFSSLSYLKHFPVNKLKMVEPFVSFVAIHPNDEVIARAIVAMAHSLNIKVIAEGVENEEHLAFLRLLHCDELQGNMISQPLPAEEAVELLSKNKLF